MGALQQTSNRSSLLNSDQKTPEGSRPVMASFLMVRANRTGVNRQ
jgi:hypothetical protein